MILNQKNRFDIGKYYNDRPYPNPTTYFPSSNLILPSSGNWTFGRSAKSEFLKEVAWRAFEPGPDRYEKSPRK